MQTLLASGPLDCFRYFTLTNVVPAYAFINQDNTPARIDGHSTSLLHSPRPVTILQPVKKMSSVQPAFWNRLACFAFESYLKSGIGVCVLREDFPGPIADAPFSYLPYDPENPAFDKLPDKTVAMLDDYDPKREVVVALIDKAEKALAMQLTAQKMGLSLIHI